ncbi:TetR/AcrR family transcriptional regulator [Gemmobacter lutimaris]|uniref:TetR/AcrR family transcriptional regulator n=2 Tax=Gemmobacter TaxID=204456 RepID=A0A398BN31_9RHOB|nr:MULTISPECIES: TetR/AcrR family transcriptional regulator [Gemmobacter]PTX47278.1 TetR family transcriptional regulator [Gemmobacter caeni]RID89928.1 TetR/AcrR family transcriptional regulator [Gemmobacter lutimaris]TWI96390.1 TetR family transcriptional regulator [Gemmobacter caeni]
MRQEAQKARRKEIEQAALALLVQHGYAATTMASVAKAVGASLETLYKWYGDKPGLFRAMVQANIEELRDGLLMSAATFRDPIAALQEFGPRLIAVLTSEEVVALNRAAAADPSGDLGRIIAETGRGSIAPQLTGLFDRAMESDDPAQITEIYLGLLLGDLQIRRVIGRMPPPDATEIRQRSDRALELLCRLFPACPSKLPSEISVAFA